MNRPTIMHKRLIMQICIALFLSSFAYADEGKIKICRHHGLTELMDRKIIPIPAGSSFTTSGETSDFIVSTTADVALGKKPACVVAPVTLTENQGGKPVTKKTGLLVPQFSTPGATLEAHVVEDLK